MASPTAPIIDQNGITVPTYASVLAYLQQQYQAIFGTDAYLNSDSQDGQLLAIFAAAINDANAAAVAVYNSFSPATAQGNGLSSNVKINGLSRLVPSYSTVEVLVTGVYGTTITNGIVGDTNGNLWNLPANVLIPSSGQILVTATAQQLGAITAAANTVTTINTPTYGWQSVSNPTAAAPGQPVETDAQLRVRQSNSVALPSLTVLAGIVGAVEAVPGVIQVAAYENDTNSTNSLGIPPHSMALVVQGGDSTAIATAIMQKKTPGALTFGTTPVTLMDSVGAPHTISFTVPTLSPIAINISLHALTGYNSNIATEITNALVSYIGSFAIGQSLLIPRLYVPAQLSGSADSNTFEIVSIAAAIKPATPGTTDITVTYNQLLTLASSDITLAVV